MEEVTKLLERLEKMKDYYYDDDIENNDEMIKECSKIDFEQYQFIIEENPKSVQYLICPDLEYEFPFIIKSSKEQYEGVLNAAFDAVKEYHAFSDFYDEIVGITSDELLKMYLIKNNASIIEYIDMVFVDMLNIRKIRSEI